MNKKLWADALYCIPGGVNSPVRAFNAVGGTPFFTSHAKDACLYDVEGTKYIDYISSWGANIVGHANEYVVSKVSEALNNGFSYGTPTELEVVFAQRICKLMPSIEKLRLVSSGTEALMSAIRLARGYTSRKYIVKFNGCYHGHSDNLLVSAGSGLATFSTPSSAGVNPEMVEHTLVLEYNDIEGLQQAFATHTKEIAAVVIEPFAGNMNLVRPTNEFIQTLRDLCDKDGSLLIFDEVMTGFRVALGGAQSILNITPDLTTLGKVIGGGMPLAAFGGRADIMNCLSPLGSVYQAGTLSGNPIAVTCGMATLDLITVDGFYANLTHTSATLMQGLDALAAKHGIEFCTDYIGGMFGFYFAKSLPESLPEVSRANKDLFNRFFHNMLKGGVYFAPSMYEAGFVCAKHSAEDIAETLLIADSAFAQLAF